MRCPHTAARFSRFSTASSPAGGAARAKRGAEELLEQRRLAVGGGAEDAQVAAGDAVLCELGGGADDLEVGLVEASAGRRVRSG